MPLRAPNAELFEVNIVLFDHDDFVKPSAANSSGRIAVHDHRASHIRKVLKLEVGAAFRIGRVGDRIGIGRIVESTANGEYGTVIFEVESLDQEPPTASPVELILALPRPKSLKRCLRAIANLGIKSVHLIHSIRVEKSYWTAPALKPDIARSAMLEGLAIACDTRLPIIRQHHLFKPFVQDVAPHLVCETALVAHPDKRGDKESRLSFESLSGNSIQIAIGPEGGFSDYEVGLFNEAGFRNFSLGSRVYSVECAIPVIEATIRAHKQNR